jgi:hypothetical protein
LAWHTRPRQHSSIATPQRLTDRVTMNTMLTMVTMKRCVSDRFEGIVLTVAIVAIATKPSAVGSFSNRSVTCAV